MLASHPLTREAARRGRRGNRRRRGKPSTSEAAPTDVHTHAVGLAARAERERERPLSAQQRPESGRAVRGGVDYTE